MLKNEKGANYSINRSDWGHGMETLERLPTNQRHNDEDASLMTYSGHQVLQTLIRARFSPPHVTGQRYIYAGSYNGKVYSKEHGNTTKAV